MKKTHGFEKPDNDKREAEYEQTREKSTVEKLFERFLRDKRFLANLSERTLDSYTDVFNRWMRFIGPEIPTEENLQTFVMGQREAGFTVTTVNISIRSWNSFLSWLHENKHLSEHLKIKQLKQEKRAMKTFSDGQLQVLLNWRPDLHSRNEVRLHVLIFLL